MSIPTRFGRKAALAASVLVVVGTGALPASAQVKADAVAVQKLEANANFPYTQVSLHVPRISGPGLPAQEAAVVTGLDIVLSSQRQAQRSELSVSWRGQQLGQVRYVGKDIYVMLDVAHWASLPLKLSASARNELARVDLVLGERWFEVPATVVRAAVAATKSLPPATKRLPSPTALRVLVTGALAKFAGSLDLSEAPLPGGNERFAERGTLGSLAGALSRADKALVARLGLATSAPNGTYYLQMSTAAGGQYMAQVEVAIAMAQKQSLTAELTFTHAASPVLAPANATLVTSSMLKGLGL